VLQDTYGRSNRLEVCLRSAGNDAIQEKTMWTEQTEIPFQETDAAVARGTDITTNISLRLLTPEERE
jgi:hypothetical protein